MHRTTHTILVAGLAALAMGATAVPAQARAAGVVITPSVRASWDFSGQVAGVPGNHHVGSFVVEDNAGSTDFVSLQLIDYDCPGVATPESGQCAEVRGTFMVSDATIGFSSDRTLKSASVDTTFPGSYLVDGVWVDAPITIDADLVGAGSRTRESQAWEEPNGTAHRITTETRPAEVTGTVGGVRLESVTGEIGRRTYR